MLESESRWLPLRREAALRARVYNCGYNEKIAAHSAPEMKDARVLEASMK